jgi:drug/metabolite transporter (DMT)-like permease
LASQLQVASGLTSEADILTGRDFSKIKHHTCVILAVIANTLGNFLLSVGMRQMDFRPSASPLEYLQIFANPWIAGGVLLLIVWFASQLSLLSWSDLSYVLPITGASYVLTAVLGKVFLHEFVSISRWLGILAISLGVILVIGSAPKAKLGPREIIP